MLARRHLAHRLKVIANSLFDVGQTPLAQQALHMPIQTNFFKILPRHYMAEILPIRRKNLSDQSINSSSTLSQR